MIENPEAQHLFPFGIVLCTRLKSSTGRDLLIKISVCGPKPLGKTAAVRDWLRGRKAKVMLDMFGKISHKMIRENFFPRVLTALASRIKNYWP
jgi:hypothetical protein